MTPRPDCLARAAAIRPIGRIGRDGIDRLVQIDRECYPHPWTVDDFLAALVEPGVSGLVAELHGSLVGYLLSERKRRTRRMQLQCLAVDPLCQRERIATALLSRLQHAVSGSAGYASHIRTHVRESNLPAQAFLRSRGFRFQETLPDWYDGPTEAGYRFVWSPCGGSL